MKDNIQVVIITLVLFLAGLLTGVWTQKTKATPPPFLPFMGEFNHDLLGERHGSMPLQPPWENRQMPAEDEQQKTQIEAFEQKLATIKSESRSKMEAILTPEQKVKFADFQKAHASSQSGKMSFHGFLEPQFVGLLIYKPQVARLTSELGFDASQSAKADEILKMRRQAVIDLFDTNPPPSAMQGRRFQHQPPAPDAPSATPEADL